MALNAAEQERLAQVLMRIARGIAVGLGHDPDDPQVAEVIGQQFREGYEWIVLAQTEDDVTGRRR